jgi:hypothetical protein
MPQPRQLARRPDHRPGMHLRRDRGHPLGIGGIPVHNVENACASAGDALHLAWTSIVAGLTTPCSCWAPKLWLEDQARTFSAWRSHGCRGPFDSVVGAGQRPHPSPTDGAHTAAADGSWRHREMLAEASSQKLSQRLDERMRTGSSRPRPRKSLPADWSSRQFTSLMSSPVSDGGAAAAELRRGPRSR